MQRIVPCVWFDGRLEEAMELYTSVFPGSRVTDVTRWGDAGPGPKGSVLSSRFVLDGVEFIALNDRPAEFGLTPAVSFFVKCATQAEIDGLWDRLVESGAPQRCGWLTDRFGVSWQIVPTVLGEMLGDPDPAKAGRVMRAMLGMVKLDVAGLRRAYDAP